MYKGLKLRWLALIIEHHWAFIAKDRRKGCLMMAEGIPLSSPQMLSLSNHIAKHCFMAMVAQNKYKNLCGLKDLLVRY